LKNLILVVYHYVTRIKLTIYLNFDQKYTITLLNRTKFQATKL